MRDEELERYCLCVAWRLGGLNYRIAFLGGLGVLGGSIFFSGFSPLLCGSIIVLGSLGVLAVQLFFVTHHCP
jgi:hypothetical protein